MKSLLEIYKKSVEDYHRHDLPAGAPDFHPAIALTFGALLVSSLVLPATDALLNDRKATKALFGSGQEQVAETQRPSLLCDNGRGVIRLNDKQVTLNLVPFTPCIDNTVTAEDFNPPLK